MPGLGENETEPSPWGMWDHKAKGVLGNTQGGQRLPNGGYRRGAFGKDVGHGRKKEDKILRPEGQLKTPVALLGIY